MKLLGIIILASTLFGCATHHAVKQPFPAHQAVFYSGVALYRNKHPIGLVTGSDRFLSCQEALEDTRGVLQKLLVSDQDGVTGVGLCIPVPIYDVTDLIPQSVY